MNTNNGTARRWVSLDAAAEYLGISPRTVRRMIAEGRLTGYRVGPRLVRVDLTEIDALAVQIDPSNGSAL